MYICTKIYFMKNINALLFAAAAAFLMSCGGAEPTEEVIVLEPVTYTLDSAASSLEWTGRKNQGDDKHIGMINITEGSVEVLDGVITSGNFTVDMKTLATTDELPVAYQEKLNGHLKAADFFDTEKYPTADVKVGELKDGKLPTTITLMGTEFTSNIPVEVNTIDDKVTIKGTFDFDFTGLKSVGFMADPKTGEQILSVFSYNLIVVLKK